MRRLIVGTPNFSDATVGSHDDNRRHLVFQSTIQERETLNVQHVNLVDEEDTRYYFGFAFFPPFGHLTLNNQLLSLTYKFRRLTFPFICSRTSGLISPVSPAKRAINPWVLLFMTSISCRVTVWTTSFLFWSSPSGHWTKRVWWPVAS